MKPFRIPLGAKARDVVTGFVGIVVGQARYLTGCDQFVLAPKADESNKVDRGEWFDDVRLEIVELNAVALPDLTSPTEPVAVKGGPQRDAPR